MIEKGSLFEWVYQTKGVPVDPNEMIWSWFTHTWVPCSGLCIAVKVNGDKLTYTNEEGLFCVRVDETRFGASGERLAWRLFCVRVDETAARATL